MATTDAATLIEEIILTAASYHDRRNAYARDTAPAIQDWFGRPVAQPPTERVASGRELPREEHNRYRDELRSLYTRLGEAERDDPTVSDLPGYGEAMRLLVAVDDFRRVWGGPNSTLEPIR